MLMVFDALMFSPAAFVRGDDGAAIEDAHLPIARHECDSFARVPRWGGLPRSSRVATEVVRLHAGLEPLCREELEMPRTGQAMKQRRPAATDNGMNDDAIA
jgi:hypothetical protein